MALNNNQDFRKPTRLLNFLRTLSVKFKLLLGKIPAKTKNIKQKYSDKFVYIQLLCNTGMGCICGVWDHSPSIQEQYDEYLRYYKYSSKVTMDQFKTYGRYTRIEKHNILI